MADLSDVMLALATVVETAVYPNGTGGASAVGAPCGVYPGWPNSDQLDADLRAGKVTISIYPAPNMARNETRYPRQWVLAVPSTPTLGVFVAGSVVTFLGAGGTGQIAGVLCQGTGYVHVVSGSDTPATVATAFAAAIPGASASGAVLTLPTGGDAPIANVVAQQTSSMELRRQEQGFWIMFYCATVAARDAAAKAVDSALAALDFIALPGGDNSSGWLRYKGDRIDDVPSKDRLWRRDLVYTVEYPTTQLMLSPDMLFGTLTVNGATPGLVTTVPQALPAPLVGAIRFDAAWYAAATANAAGSVEAQAMATLSPAVYEYRLPFFATVSGGVASIPAPTQANMDLEISAALTCGLNYWAFDSFEPTDDASTALAFYLSSTIRSQIGFCMLGQVSNWNTAGNAEGIYPPYAPSVARDISMFAQAGYVKVLGGRPLYYILGYGSSSEMASGLAYIRAQSIAQGTGNPYIVGLAGAALADFNDVTGWAIASGCDAAGAYENPRLNGSVQPYANLVANAETDWQQRSIAGLPMVPTAMTDFDPRPLIQTPIPSYSIPSGWGLSNYFQQGMPAQIAQHIADMVAFIEGNPAACPANVGLVYAWNELGEGGRGLIPSYVPGNPYGNVDRGIAVGAALST